MKSTLTYIFLSLFTISLYGQQQAIESIFISGNKRTKDRVILRELTFAVGDSILEGEDLIALAEYNKNRVLGTGLFNSVEVFFENTEKDHLKAVIDVNENWYIFPSPIFELADRNFNLWWYDLGRDLSRVNYGLRAEHVNLSGNRDKLALTAQLGYTRKLELKYNFPFLDKEGKWSTSINAFYADVREISYATRNNKTQFGRNNEEIMLTRLRFGADLAYRRDLYSIQVFRLEYYDNIISDYAANVLNPNYFLDARTQNQYFLFNYVYILDKRQFLIFPTSGLYFQANFKKEGLFVFNDINNMSLSLEVEKHFNFQKKWIYSFRIKGKANLLDNQLAFANNTALGWGNDVLRGYELYAIDGSDFAYAKTSVDYKFFDHLFDLSGFIPVPQFNQLDLKLYIGTGLEIGYAREQYYIETNAFNNRPLVGFGPTMSIMLYNTYLFQIDYSWNHTGEGGLYVGNKISF